MFTKFSKKPNYRKTEIRIRLQSFETMFGPVQVTWSKLKRFEPHNKRLATRPRCDMKKLFSHPHSIHAHKNEKIRLEKDTGCDCEYRSQQIAMERTEERALYLARSSAGRELSKIM